MASLPENLRRTLEKTVIEAREVAEAGAQAALERLAVHRSEPFREMSPDERDLRARLRAHARQLGHKRKDNGEQDAAHLVAECAYEHWHRMLFARFLSENHLLIHSEHGVPISLAECEELAAAEGQGDGWALAARFAARMLPAIFRPDDPVLRVPLAPEHQQPLERLVGGLPADVFTAHDSLGWVYQFWQTKRKKEVNESGRKIGANELPAVTQLFTEPYMVKFLLHNTLGGWWAGKMLAPQPKLAASARDEDELRRACGLPGYEWDYLRFVREGEPALWRPAAGTFEAWPARAGQLRVLDPCCGSGHFLVEALRILVAMRIAEDGLSAREACDAVLSDNLFGLEIDERCTQIAAFNLALAAWTYPGGGGYRPLPELHIACSGLSVGAKEEEWLKVAGHEERLRGGMRRLYRLFKDAPTLGSLIDPRREGADLLAAGFEELRPLLATALEHGQVKRDAVAAEAGIAAQGMAKAAALLAGSYALVVTNVPYLGRGKQDDVLKDYCERVYPEAKADLATCFVERCLDFCASGGSTALVTPQNWLFLTSYRRLRQNYLTQSTWNFVARLGPRAFDTISGEVVSVSLLGLTRAKPLAGQAAFGVDAAEGEDAGVKAEAIRSAELLSLRQAGQLQNPDARMVLGSEISSELLAKFAFAHKGLTTNDDPQFLRCFWELMLGSPGWEFHQSTVQRPVPYGGREHIILFEGGRGRLRAMNSEQERDRRRDLQGVNAWGRKGVAISLMTQLFPTLYSGEKFDTNVSAIVPDDARLIPAIWTYCNSPEFQEQVRKIDRKLNVTNATLVKIAFDLARWQKVAAENYPSGLPRPFSDHATQWIFHGHPCGSVIWDEEKRWTAHGLPRTDGAVLQVAVARLLGYHWPAELEPTMELAEEQREWVGKCDQLLELVHEDGIVCIAAVCGEQPAVSRIQALLARAYGAEWAPSRLASLLEQVGFKEKSPEEWLRDGFFEQHCELFHQRPFVWQIWDGRRRDGFAALVNYHKLDRKRLERLAYTYLGDWIEQQRAAARKGESGAEDRLGAALWLQKKLALILEGEPPHDIFVRWKPLERQPIGWEPDLNDGVRLNIRPFVTAGVLRRNPRINWNKDRGTEPHRRKEQYPWFWKDGKFTGERVNDVHLTIAEKRAAQAKARVST